LFVLGADLATPVGSKNEAKVTRVAAREVAFLEEQIDAATARLPAIKSFVLPGGTAAAAQLHVARTVCRRAERLLVALARREEVPPETIRYLNRLSDALFVWSRWANHVLGVAEVLWEPNEAASARKPIE
jgi:cob(I)alamin adenosyltransferase